MIRLFDRWTSREWAMIAQGAAKHMVATGVPRYSDADAIDAIMAVQDRLTRYHRTLSQVLNDRNLTKRRGVLWLIEIKFDQFRRQEAQR